MEIETTSTHPNPQPDLHHRKIELQSPLDLTYLQTNLATSARQKLDLHFPPSALRQKPQPATVISLGGPSPDASGAQQLPHSQKGANPDEDMDEDNDPLRQRVRELVAAFLARTWAGAADNITINGLDATEFPSLRQQPAHTSGVGGGAAVVDKAGECEGVDFTYESYDGKLQAQVASLYGELEALTAQVSRLRREAPGKGAELYKNEMERRREGEERVWEERRGVLLDGKGERLELLSGAGDEWREDVREMYERGIGELARLGGLAGKGGGRLVEGGSLTETVGKAQRARTVAVELE